MSITLKNFTRRPFNVDAIQVTVENMEELATLCKGNVDKDFIRVPLKRPQAGKAPIARVGDWLAYAQGGWKVYNNKAFLASFQDTVAVANDLEGFAKREAGN